MRIAVSGAQRVGKSTLIEALAERLPGYVVIDEPYHQLEDEGHELSDPPTREDFEAQLRVSIASLADAPANALLERAPHDFLAYLGDDLDLDDWPGLRAAADRLDLIVVVPVEAPDRIALPAHESGAWRARIDEAVQAIVLDDRCELGVRSIEVRGDVAARVEQVLRLVQPPRAKR